MQVKRCVSRQVPMFQDEWLMICVQAKKRQLIEQRLQNKLRKETDSVRRAEEAKKEKTASNRKEEELQLKDSIVRTISIIVFLHPRSLPITTFSINSAVHDYPYYPTF